MHVFIIGLIVWLAVSTSTKTDKKISVAEANPPSEAKEEVAPQAEVAQQAKVKQETYFLQVDAFFKQEEADQLKKDLALHGFEAIVQSLEIPNKGTIHRVRIGPFTDIETIYKTNSDLQTNGFSANLIKVQL